MLPPQALSPLSPVKGETMVPPEPELLVPEPLAIGPSRVPVPELLVPEPLAIGPSRVPEPELLEPALAEVEVGAVGSSTTAPEPGALEKRSAKVCRMRQHTCLRTCLHTCPHTCPHTCLHTCPHTCAEGVGAGPMNCGREPVEPEPEPLRQKTAMETCRSPMARLWSPK